MIYLLITAMIHTHTHTHTHTEREREREKFRFLIKANSFIQHGLIKVAVTACVMLQKYPGVEQHVVVLCWPRGSAGEWVDGSAFSPVTGEALQLSRWTGTGPVRVLMDLWDLIIRQHCSTAAQTHQTVTVTRGNGAESRWNGSWTTPAPLSGPESHGGATVKDQREDQAWISVCVCLFYY